MASALSSSLLESDEEIERGNIPPTLPLRLDWVDLSLYGLSKTGLAVSEMPGCRFKENWRELDDDIDVMKLAGIESVYVLITDREISRYRATGLLGAYKISEIAPHHYPIEDGMCPSFNEMTDIVAQLLEELKDKKCLVHCHGGLGRACLVVACLLLTLDSGITADDTIETMRCLRGRRAIQTVKQYNFLHDYQEFIHPIVGED